MPQYNVLTENWIPIETLDGKSKLVGMLEVLIHAHEIKCVKAASPLVTYGIQRTLIALLIDAFRPYDIDALAEIIGKGEFDDTTLNGYIKKCIEEGVSFDLFDENRPFMQTQIKEKLNTEISLINKIFLEIPEGNNHTHFVHRMENEHKFTPAECAQALCTVPAFSTKYGRNNYFSINGIPPIYFLYAGRNLFETLSTSMITESEHREIPLDSPPIVWRNFSTVEREGKVAKTSLLYGLTCQPRCIKLIPIEQDGCIFVKEMYYSKGWDFKELPNWVDPHVVYIHDKRGDYSLKAHEGKAVWRDLGSILSTNSSPRILNGIERKLDSVAEYVSLNTFCVIGKKSIRTVFVAESWFEESLNFDISIMKNESKAKIISDVLIKAEEVNKILCRVVRKSIRQLQGIKGSDKEHSRFASLEKQAKNLYFSMLRVYIFGDFCSIVSKTEATPVDWDIIIKKQAGKTLKSSAESAFETICNNLGTSAKTFEWRAVAEIKLRRNIYKELKGGWLDE